MTTELPNCLDCKYGDAAHPCRRADGGYDAVKVACALVQHGRAFDTLREVKDQNLADEHAWAFDCAYDVGMEHPNLVVPLAVAAMDACETVSDAARISAGLIEDALIKHGPALIDDVERLGQESAKVRYFLSGIWGRRHIEPAVWQRISDVIGEAGRMDADGRTPHAGGTVTVLSEADVARLLQDRVTDTARRLGLV